MNSKIRVHLIISGRVQGVFFRMETKKEAEKNSVSGWVKNRYDGTVEAVLEGEKKSVETLIRWCKKGPPNANVTDVNIKSEAFKGEFERFEIVY